MSLRASIKQRTEAMLAPVVHWLHTHGVRPNHVSVAGGALAVLGAWPAASGHFTTAALLFLIGSALDACDGVLARRHDQTTRFGAVLDATLDRIGEGALWLGLIAWFAAQHAPLWAALAAGAMLFSLLTSYLRAWGERFSARMSDDWLTRPERVLLLGLCLLLGRPEIAAGAVALLAAVGFGWRLWRLSRLL